jgi:hypothetical protein
MQNINALRDQQTPQTRNESQGKRSFSTDWPVEVLRAAIKQRRQQPPSGRDHQRTVTGINQCRRDFQGTLLDTAAMQGG